MATTRQKNRQPITSAPAPADKAMGPQPTEMLEVENVRDASHFFKREDWWAAAATFVFSTLVFFRHMAPEVTLQDSGELVTGAFNFGVPHPPGYPLWALLGYIWSHVVVPFGNPAWRIGTMSVFTGGLTVGILTIMMTRSTRLLLDTLPWADAIEDRLLHWIALLVGISTALLFGFNRGVWLWASVSEMRVLNAFSFVLIACTFFAWMIQPQRKGFLYATLLIFGLSMTNHQTVGVMALALVVGTLAEGLERFFNRRSTIPEADRPGDLPLLMTSLTTFWELSVAVMFSLAAVFLLFAWLRTPNMGPLFEKDALGPDIWRTVVLFGLGIAGVLGMLKGGIESWMRKLIALGACIALVAFYWQASSDPLVKQGALTLTVCLLAAGAVALGVGEEFGWIKPRKALLYTGLFLAGCAFYLYMPIASATNPPMNWGYAATKEGFLHAITRGQYEKLQMADPFGSVFGIQIWIFIRGVFHQYSWPLSLFGLITLAVVTVWMLRRLIQNIGEYLWIVIVWLVFLPVFAISVWLLRAVVLGLPTTTIWPALIWGVALTTVLSMLIGAWLYLRWPGRSWLIFVWAAFLASSIGLILIINPKLDKQEQEITIKFFAPAHGFYAMLIGYGIAMMFAFVLWLRTRLPRLLDWLVWAGSVALAAVPLSLAAIRTTRMSAFLAAIDAKLHQLFGFSLGLQTQHTLLIVCGAALVAIVALWWLKRRSPRLLVQLACCSLLALPLIPYAENWELCALQTHDFGYQFGYRMFCPGGGYPDMEKDAVLYGGTDPGRFVPTYMIFCESRVKPGDRFQSPNLPGNGHTFDRSDVYIITQNALADNTYMSYIRDHYDLTRPDLNNPKTIADFASWRQFVFGCGWTWLDRAHTFPKDPIRIPTPDDSTKAFQQFVEDWKAGRAPPGADIQIENGRVQVTGVQAVMAINGILAKWIFDWNKEKHSFYVEESYVIAWMYPYLRPAGVIMKIEKEQLPSPQQDPKLWKDIVAKDKAYWDRLTSDFLAREEFRRNKDAQKSFSKMRSAIAGLYLWRGMLPEAEYAFRQSLQLCPDSPEGCFRLADLYMNQRRFDDAHKLMTDYLKVDEYNGNVISFLNQIDNLTKCETRRIELQKKMEHGAELNDVMELISIFGRMNMQSEMTSLSMNVLNNSNLPPTCLLQLAQLFGDARRVDMQQESLRRYLARMPQDSRIWIELGWTQMLMNQAGDGFASWQKAVSIGGDAARVVLRGDKRFQPLWQQHDLPPQFRELVQPVRRPPSGLDLEL